MYLLSSNESFIHDVSHSCRLLPFNSQKIAILEQWHMPGSWSEESKVYVDLNLHLEQEQSIQTESSE